jgi:hypothetical protein
MRQRGLVERLGELLRARRDDGALPFGYQPDDVTKRQVASPRARMRQNATPRNGPASRQAS